MTSASELFSSWRSRAGRVTAPDADSDPHDSRPVVSDRDLLLARRRRRGNSRRRYDVGAANRFHQRGHAFGSEHADGSRNSTSSQHDRMRFARTDRLPNTVLQAQERVSERLRGASLVGGRASISWDETGDDVFRVINLRNHASPRSQRELISNFISLNAELHETPSVPDIVFSNNRPPGLAKEEFELLKLEVFKIESDNENISASVDCCICLEKFCDEIKVVVLNCGHRFHPDCLEPWVKKCGDCPYCRTTILS